MPNPTATATRLASLDFFRGATIAFMILVNNPGTWAHVYAPLRHAKWHGCTPTDLVFPFFLFIVGVSFWFSAEKLGFQPSRETWIKIYKRTALIFLVGFLLQWYPFFKTNPFEWKSLENLRIFGVLQRIALSFGIGATICLLVKTRNLLFAVVGLMLIYWALLLLAAAPGVDPFALEGNAVQRLDLFLFGEKHLYHGFENAVGERVAFDPEGLLGAVSGAATVIIGFLCGQHIRRRGKSLDLLVRDFLLFGFGFAALGSIWHLFLPINKPLWTPSYVLFAGGLAIIGLGLAIWMLDLRKWQAGAGPFIILGMNPLFAYVFSGFLYKTLAIFSWTNAAGEPENAIGWIYKNIFAAIDAFKFGSLLYALSFVGVCFLATYFLYRRNIFWKI